MSDNKTHYKKELFSNGFIVNGAAVAFQPLDGNRGVLELDASDPLNGPLQVAASKHRGGIVRISKEQFDVELKKKFSPRSPSPLQEPLRVANPPKKSKPKESPVVESAKPESNGYPIPEPPPELSFRPTTKRLSSVLKEPKT